jgi:putative acetyltransferase
MQPVVEIVPAHTPEWIREVRTLFVEYAEEIKVDLCFQGFERELAELPGKYAPPGGRLLLARCGGSLAGCVGMRAFDGDPETCEMKRLYVRPTARGRGVGRRLAMAVIAAAREVGYARMRLDTYNTMVEAIALYRTLGFVEIGPYRHNPLPGAYYMELGLRE